jgi:alpha-amylase
MTGICFYFQVHQPFRLRKDYSFFQIGVDHFYEDSEANAAICRKVAEKCYLPANAVMLDLIRRNNGKFRIAYSISGVALEQFELYAPEVIRSFQELARTGCVEFISETYYHSLAFLFSEREFRDQVFLHRKKIKELFGVVPTTFRNTELIYSNELARAVDAMGFKTILAEGADQVLGWRSPNFLYKPAGGYKLNLLLKNYRLSDDIAFRFSNRDWPEYPLTAEKYASWIHALAGQAETVNLFMDYETFGEHQWADTGIFDFMRALPDAIHRHPDFRFVTPSEVSGFCSPVAKVDVPYFISWADVERDLTAWLGNPIQDEAIRLVYEIERQIRAVKDPDLHHVWRKLQTSDHFYYMCTKWFSDGDVHKYFNPYATPFDAYVAYTNVLNDLAATVESRIRPKGGRRKTHV